VSGGIPHIRGLAIRGMFGSLRRLKGEEACGAQNSDMKILSGGRDGDESCAAQFTWR
jgi:hypothetical protein